LPSCIFKVFVAVCPVHIAVKVLLKPRSWLRIEAGLKVRVTVDDIEERNELVDARFQFSAAERPEVNHYRSPPNATHLPPGGRTR
jgi:hypothetical protein